MAFYIRIFYAQAKPVFSANKLSTQIPAKICCDVDLLLMYLSIPYQEYLTIQLKIRVTIFVAGNQCIPEVCVYFNHKLIRGNRTIKVNYQR